MSVAPREIACLTGSRPPLYCHMPTPTSGSITPVFARSPCSIAHTPLALDGIYVIRSSVTASTLDAAAVVSAYKDLKYVERDFRIAKADDLDLRPIYHYLADRIRGHVLICMLACYLTWHLRQALAELTFTDQHIPPRPGRPRPPLS